MSSVLDDPQIGVEVSARIEAELNYLQDTGVRPVAYTYEPPAGIPWYTGESDPRRVTLHNARLEHGLGLDQSGFGLISHRSKLTQWDDFQDEARVKALYYPEVEAALIAHTGASKVVIFDHTLRNSDAPTRRGTVREVARRVHDDQTFESAPKRVLKHLSADEAEQRLKRRFAIVNFWRPLVAPIESHPLALCDARSISLQDLIPSDLVYREWTGETYSFRYSPKHRWYWYPNQSPDEVTLLKIYDSATDGTARLTAHTSFEDPTSPPDARPRRSIEVRTLVFW